MTRWITPTRCAVLLLLLSTTEALLPQQQQSVVQRVVGRRPVPAVQRRAVERQEEAPARRALVIGGSGRVGASTVRWLDAFARAEGRRLALTVGGRDGRNFESTRERWRRQDAALSDVAFREVDLNDAASLRAAVADADLVVHTAGPFQGVREPKVLDACLAEAQRRPLAYVDVCDETELCRLVKSTEYRERAAASALRAVVSAGIWPGASALMALDAIDLFFEDDDTERALEDVAVDFDFFTAGTGGAGPTIVSATFLLLVTPALVYRNGEPRERPAWTEPRSVTFGSNVNAGRAVTTRLLDCPEVLTLVETLKASNTPRFATISAASRFATAPELWNRLFGACKAILPAELLADRAAMQRLALFSEPIVRLVDALVGSQNVMRVRVEHTNGGASSSTTRRRPAVEATHVHEDLEAAVGIATAAFALDVLDDAFASEAAGGGGPPPSGSILWPADLPALRREAILRRVLEAPGTQSYEVRREEAGR